MEAQNEPHVASIIAGYPTRKKIAADLNCSERTIIRLEHQGMPVIKLGNLRLYNPEAVRAWIMAHERRHDVPKRSRPAKRAA
jgi:phage terminase Nu1 subunit (DNA packaging protein)